MVLPVWVSYHTKKLSFKQVCVDQVKGKKSADGRLIINFKSGTAHRGRWNLSGQKVLKKEKQERDEEDIRYTQGVRRHQGLRLLPVVRRRLEQRILVFNDEVLLGSGGL